MVRAQVRQMLMPSEVEGDETFMLEIDLGESDAECWTSRLWC
jgi:hypothetical protein